VSEVRRTMRRTGVAAVVTAVAATTVCVTGGAAGADAWAVETRDVTTISSVVNGSTGTGDAMSYLRVSGRFAPPTAVIPPSALTYRQALVPAAGRISVSQDLDSGGMRIGVAVSGLKPRHTFGVHVHTAPCGAKPEAAGPHYQHKKDPVQPSVDPAYANPRNEVWLDLTTDRTGSGEASVRQRWSFRPGEARSVVLHEGATHRGHGKAGQAGDRVACFSVPFDGQKAT
jgi:superoxide dismutase, Cu-Zn family